MSAAWVITNNNLEISVSCTTVGLYKFKQIVFYTKLNTLHITRLINKTKHFILVFTVHTRISALVRILSTQVYTRTYAGILSTQL